MESWRGLLSDCVGKIENIIFGGFGEPTLHPHFHRLLLDLEENDICSSFSTNGILIRKSLLDILPKLRKLKHVNISIDSPDPDVYKVIRGGKLEKALENVREIAAQPSHFTVTVASIAMKTNIDTLKLFPPILAGLGVRHYIVQSLMDWSDEGIGEDLHTKTDGATAVENLRNASIEAGINLQFLTSKRVDDEVAESSGHLQSYFCNVQNNNAMEKRSRACMLPWESVHIDASGAVFPCCTASATNESKLGDINQSPLSDIWIGRPYQEFRNRLLLQDDRGCPEVCANCTIAEAGMPPVDDVAAEIVAQIIGRETIEIDVRNIGRRDGSASLQPLIGTAGPRNRISQAYETSWLSQNRVAATMEPVMKPGDLGHYSFKIARGLRSRSETFQLVVDGLLWLPNTRFEIR
jgi:radical SAM protein with 4Fe4S-binding SPASM domain